jgi:hypothetical protein
VRIVALVALASAIEAQTPQFSPKDGVAYDSAELFASVRGLVGQ